MSDVKTSIADALHAVGKTRKAPKGPSRHYPQFNEDEWNIVKKGFGDDVQPMQIKQIVLAIATGTLTFDKAAVEATLAKRGSST